jgi:hypothetical protein
MKQGPSDTPHKAGAQPPVTSPPAGVPTADLDIAQQTQVALAGILDTTAGERKILVTESRLRLVLTEHAGRLSSNWAAPLGIFASLGVALITSDFKSTRLGITSGTWEVAFLMAWAAAGLWTLAALVFRFASGARKRRIDACVNDIKKPTAAGTPQPK